MSFLNFKKLKTSIFLLFSLLVLAAVTSYIQSNMRSPSPPDNDRAQTQSQQPPSESLELKDEPEQTKHAPGGKQENDVAPAPNVTVIQVQAKSHQAQINAFGVALPQYELDLQAQVTGEVISISEKLDSGMRVNKNDVLLNLDDSHYLVSVASAKAEVADAKLGLLETQREAIQTKAEWKTIGLKNYSASKLALQVPQLAVAKAVLAKAKANLISAERDQSKTQILSPFDALVVERYVTPGSYVQAGTEIVKLYSSEKIEIALALPTSDWQNLANLKNLAETSWPVQLSSVENGESWNGYIVRLEQHLDETTRQHTLIAAVDRPLDQEPKLFPGTFLHALIKGRSIEGLWKLPNSALSQRSEIWYVKQDKTLARFKSKIIFADADSIYIFAPDELADKPQRVLISPLNSYLQGMSVTPVDQLTKAAKKS